VTLRLLHLLLFSFLKVQMIEKKWEYCETVRQLFIDLNKAHDSFSRDVLCNILIEFGIPMKLVKLIKYV
jgi:hypothetical protein